MSVRVRFDVDTESALESALAVASIARTLGAGSASTVTVDPGRAVVEMEFDSLEVVWTHVADVLGGED